MSKLILGFLCLFVACPFLQACLFDTKTPRALPLKIDSTFFQYNPLVITFLEDSGKVTDTLYQGPGNLGGSLTRKITVEGLADSGQVRIEGYIGGNLTYLLFLPYPVDSLIATPRWVPLGQPLLDFQSYFHSMVIHQGKPFVMVSAGRGTPPYLMGFDGVAWRQEGQRNMAVGFTERELLFSDSDQLASFRLDGPVKMDLYSASKWNPALDDSALWAQSYSFQKGNVAAVVTPIYLETTYVRLYAEDQGWKAVETKSFPGYAVPGGWRGFSPGTIAHGEGLTALFLQKFKPGHLVSEYVVFQEKDGKWDSTPPLKNFSMSSPNLVLENGTPYVVFVDLTADSLTNAWTGRHISLIRHGPDGWKLVGTRNIFGKNAWKPSLRFYGGMPYVGAYCEGKGYRVGRYKDSRWETLVDFPLSAGYENDFDFSVDDLGALYLAVSVESGLKVLKFTDPRLP